MKNFLKTTLSQLENHFKHNFKDHLTQSELGTARLKSCFHACQGCNFSDLFPLSKSTRFLRNMATPSSILLLSTDLFEDICRLYLNKAYVRLTSCHNVQTERKIFEYANWSRLQIKRNGPSAIFLSPYSPEPLPHARLK